MELIPYDIQEAKTKGKVSYVVSKSSLQLTVIKAEGKDYDKFKWMDYWWFDSEIDALKKLEEKLTEALKETQRKIKEKEEKQHD